MDVDEVLPLLVEFRRYFHRHPELSTQEFATQAYIAGVLDKYDIRYRKYGTGIIAEIGEEGPCVAIRAEMDALSVKEETGLEFASETEGVMHACGHDMHMAMVLGAAIKLKILEDMLDGVVKIVFQPSEERRPGGARLLLPELLKNPKPQAIFAQHVSPELPTGTIGVRGGEFFSSSDNVIFSVTGKGTHAGTPHLGSDPILAASHLIQFYQTLVTRFTNPLEPAVLSITSIHGGSSNNVIPDRVDVTGTLRTYDNELRHRIFELLDEKSEAICGLYGCHFERDKTLNGLPVLVNDSDLTNQLLICTVLMKTVEVCSMPRLALGEDFAIYLEQIPGVMWLLGVRPPKKETMPPLHSSKMSPDEDALEMGMNLLTECVFWALAELLKKQKSSMK